MCCVERKACQLRASDFLKPGDRYKEAFRLGNPFFSIYILFLIAKLKFKMFPSWHRHIMVLVFTDQPVLWSRANQDSHSGIQFDGMFELGF